MMLIDHTGAVVPDRWTLAEEGAPWPAGPAIVPLDRLATLTAEDCAGELGVSLTAGVDLAPLLPWLDRVGLVAIAFPGFRDGRGFTLARSLRERHGYAGPIRVTGPVLPDQYVALLRVGVTEIALPDEADLGPWRQALRLNAEAGEDTPALPWIRRFALPFAAG